MRTKGTTDTDTVLGLFQTTHDFDGSCLGFGRLVELVVGVVFEALVLPRPLQGQADPTDIVIKLIRSPVRHERKTGVAQRRPKNSRTPYRFVRDQAIDGVEFLCLWGEHVPPIQGSLTVFEQLSVLPDLSEHSVVLPNRPLMLGWSEVVILVWVLVSKKQAQLINHALLLV